MLLYLYYFLSSQIGSSEVSKNQARLFKFCCFKHRWRRLWFTTPQHSYLNMKKQYDWSILFYCTESLVSAIFSSTFLSTPVVGRASLVTLVVLCLHISCCLSSTQIYSKNLQIEQQTNMQCLDMTATHSLISELQGGASFEITKAV